MKNLLDIQDAADLWACSIPYRFTFTQEERDDVALEAEEIIIGETEPLVVRQFIFESLWEHYGVTVYNFDDFDYMIDASSKNMAYAIYEQCKKNDIQADIEYFDDLNVYTKQWYKINIIGDMIHGINVDKIINSVHIAVANVCNDSAKTIQRAFRKWQHNR